MHTHTEYFPEHSGNVSLWVCHCGWEQCAPGHSYGPAVRDHYLLHYIARGRGRYQNRSGDRPLRSGQGFLITPGETSFYTADETDPWEYYWVGFKGVDASRLLELCGLSGGAPVFTPPAGSGLPELFGRLLEASRAPAGREYAMLGCLYQILAGLMDGRGLRGRPAESARLYLEEATAYINDNYSYPLTIGGLAEHIGIERSYLHRLFAAGLGTSPGQYLLKVRMSRAAELLRTTALSVQEVALSTGYPELSHFSGAFRRFYGIPPSVYRRTCPYEESRIVSAPEKR